MKILSAFFLTIFISFSCSKEEALDTWDLISICCECNPVKIEQGSIIWVFDFEKNQVIVDDRSNIDDQKIFKSGVYGLKIEGKTVTLRDMKYYINIEEDVITLNQGLDAPYYYFQKR